MCNILLVLLHVLGLRVCCLTTFYYLSLSAQMISRDISIGFWNIDGLYYRVGNQRLSKIQELESKVNSFDIICLAETHCGYDDIINFEGYKFFVNIRPKNPRAKRHSGGLAIGFRECLLPGITLLPRVNSEIMWVKIHKTFFNLEEDMYLAVVYVSPYSSSFSSQRDNIFEILEKDLTAYSKLGKCLICGDFNARTGTEDDYCSFDEYDLPSIPGEYIQDLTMPRNNLDSSSVDIHGKQFLSLCKGSGLRIINGRFLGDYLGNYTCFNYKGSPSMIDYMLTVPSLFSTIQSFYVHDPNPYSIHCILSLVIKTKAHFFTPFSRGKVHPKPVTYKWMEGDDSRYQKALQGRQISVLKDNFMEQRFTFDNASVSEAVAMVNKVLLDSADIAGLKCTKPFKHGKTKKRKGKKINKVWYDIECKREYASLKKLGQEVRKMPFNRQLLDIYRRHVHSYRKLLKKKKRQHHTSIVSQLESLSDNNPKAFWEAFNRFRETERQHKINPIPPQEWVKHFHSLLNTSHAIDEHQEGELLDYVCANSDKCFNDLNFRITCQEVSNAINKLKCGKASGKDGILNEMLKAGHTELLPVLTKLFNIVLTSGCFPDIWRINMLSPLHKKGDNTCPENYRGIAVSSHISKLLCGILHNRLTKFIDKNRVIPVNQIGFKRKSRTADHILTLKTIIDKYVFNKEPGKYLYTCFVDFKCAFDTVWRNALMYKLVQKGIGGNFLHLIKNMYSDVQYSVKVADGITEAFSSTVGVKQGCVLSPTLFNIYMSDLPSIFNDSCAPVTINGTQTNCLMFADDLVLFSETATGLQNMLNKLEHYCTKWQLRINLKKTKVMIFNKGGHVIKRFKFTYNSEALELTQKYCYLGIVFTSSGNFNSALDALNDKASKVLFKIRQFDTRQHLSLTIKLFNNLVVPILRYGCEVWTPYLMKGLNENNFSHICDSSTVEKIHNKFCKYLLGVHRKASNVAVKGELGRFPLLIELLCHSIKNWSRICDVSDFSILKSTYVEACNNMSFVPNSWASNIKGILSYFHLDSIWDNQGCLYKNRMVESLRNCMYQKYEQDWLANINRGSNSNKLRTYNTFKNTFFAENYIFHTKDISTRKWLTQLRISSHCLKIETGRYTKPIKTPLAERKCTLCQSGEVEDEFHFILKCNLYETERKLLFDSLKAFLVLDYNDEQKVFNTIMTCHNGDFEVANLVQSYVKDAFQKRKSIIGI